MKRNFNFYSDLWLDWLVSIACQDLTWPLDFAWCHVGVSIIALNKKTKEAEKKKKNWSKKKRFHNVQLLERKENHFFLEHKKNHLSFRKIFYLEGIFFVSLLWRQVEIFCYGKKKIFFKVGFNFASKSEKGGLNCHALQCNAMQTK